MSEIEREFQAGAGTTIRRVHSLVVGERELRVVTRGRNRDSKGVKKGETRASRDVGAESPAETTSADTHRGMIAMGWLRGTNSDLECDECAESALGPCSRVTLRARVR